MKNNFLITIITVVLNDAHGLENTIHSLISQTYQNIEYVVIDGGSTDSTLAVIEKYKNFINFF